MNRELIQKYLNGTADPGQQRQCETLLEDPDTIVEIDESITSDSLIKALRASTQCASSESDEAQTDGDDDRVEGLVERIQQLIPRQALGQDELERVLDPPQQDDELGRLGRYRVIEFIASGGMGLVFKAIDPELERTVCIKVMNPLLASHLDAKKRFDRESRAASRLQHERLVPVLEVGEHRDLPFLVMQLLDGESLRQRLQREERLSEREVRKVARQVAEGLSYAHAHGYLHRDVKPDNIWLTPNGNIKLLDLGLARAVDESIDLTHSGTILGTPCYMSPEQVQGRALAESSDLFSLGTVMFEMLHGVSPFDRSNVFSTMMSVANDGLPTIENPAFGNASAELRHLIERLLEKDPADRPQSADEVIAALTEQESPHKPLPAKTNSSGAGRGWSMALLGAAAAAALFLVAMFAYQQTDKGTLVIEADPDAEISLVDGTLTIRDPQSDKSYTVRVGEQPLPSGVYQLELSDEGSELTLSSEMIVIRRGEKEFVTVKLVPAEELIQNKTRGTDPDNDLNDPMSPSTLDVASNFKLAEFPALNAEEVLRAAGLHARASLNPFALVSRPQEIPEVSSWTIEPALSRDKRIREQLSPDGKRLATGSTTGMVRIYDDRLKLTHILPMEDSIVDIAWSPDPDVLAVLCYGHRHRAAVIWKLEDEGAMMLKSIPIEATRAAWSNLGDRLAFQTEDGILLCDISEGGVYSVGGATLTGRITHDAWSGDDQMLATTDEDAVKVWSLQDGLMVHRFPSVSDGRWLREGNDLRITRRSDGRYALEVWDISSLTRKEVFTAEADWDTSTLVLDDRFSRFAVCTSDGKLMTGRINETVHVQSLQREALTRRFQSLNFDLQMSADGERLSISNHWEVALFDNPLGAVTERVAGWNVLNVRRLTGIHPESYGDRGLGLVREYFLPDGPHTMIDHVDLSSLGKSTHHFSMPTSRKGIYGFRTSPAGNLIAIAERIIDQSSDEGGGPGQLPSSTITIRDLKSGAARNIDLDPDWVPQGLLWSADERFIIVKQQEAAEDSRPGTLKLGKIQVIQVADGQMIDLDLTTDRNVLLCGNRHGAFDDRMSFLDQFPLCYPLGDRLIVPVHHEPEDEEERDSLRKTSGRAGYETFLEIYDLATGELVETRPIGKLRSIDRFQAAGTWAWWRGTGGLDDGDPNTRSRAQAVASDFALNLADESERVVSSTEFVSSTSGVNDRIALSFDGNYFCFRGSQMYRQSPTLYLSVWPTRGLEAITEGSGANWSESSVTDSAFLLQPASNPVWHRDRGVMGVSFGARLQWYDAEGAVSYDHESDRGECGFMCPTDFGWIVESDGRLEAFDFEGSYLGCWLDASLYDIDDISSIAANLWVGANGGWRIAQQGADARVVQLRGNRFVTLTLDEFVDTQGHHLAPTIDPWDR